MYFFDLLFVWLGSGAFCMARTQCFLYCFDLDPELFYGLGPVIFVWLRSGAFCMARIQCFLYFFDLDPQFFMAWFRCFLYGLDPVLFVG